MTAYIGIVDLTVRLSSMNPWGQIDIRDANLQFQRCVIQACVDTHSSAGDRQEKLEAEGIIRGGSSAKFFQLENEDDLYNFIVVLRHLLLEEKIPFKICVRKGHLEGKTLSQKWGDDFIKLSSKDSKESERCREVLQENLGYDDEETIETIFKLDKSPNLTGEGLDLSMDFENFKGFGISVNLNDTSDPLIAPSEAADDEARPEGTLRRRSRLFRNHFPVQRSAKQLTTVEYWDCPFDLDDDDLVTRFRPQNRIDSDQERDASPADQAVEHDDEADEGLDTETKPERAIETAPSASTVTISTILDMLSKSQTADPDNSVYYTSLLSTLVRSSNYKELHYRAKAQNGSSSKLLAAGWQKYPPIFGTLLISAKPSGLLKRTIGIELTLAALIDEIYSSVTSEPHSAALRTDAGRSASPADERKARMQLEEKARSSSTLIRSLRRINLRYGPAIWRKILQCPPSTLSEDRKKIMIAIVSQL
ncbi:hypothetical protein V7S57_13980 [Caulobacter sp. CCNWLY153]|uniref:hypothetical protein n=1 Tax=unclassified Caulobacter TaxID=2648921 RepID=UPI002FF18592